MVDLIQAPASSLGGDAEAGRPDAEVGLVEHENCRGYGMELLRDVSCCEGLTDTH